MGLLETIFGETSEITIALGGLWFLVGFFVIIFFILLMLGNGVSADVIVLFSLMAFLLLSVDDLFSVPVTIYVTIIILLIMYIAFRFYTWLKSQ